LPQFNVFGARSFAHRWTLRRAERDLTLYLLRCSYSKRREAGVRAR
jgi:hypothetical protein